MPKFKGACIQYRQMYHYLGRFTTMYAADNFADAVAALWGKNVARRLRESGPGVSHDLVIPFGGKREY
jgi:hypothetical protein